MRELGAGKGQIFSLARKVYFGFLWGKIPKGKKISGVNILVENNQRKFEPLPPTKPDIHSFLDATFEKHHGDAGGCYEEDLK